MATLRDPFYAPNTVSLDEMEQLQNSDKGSLRRGWESGRIGSERNALGIDEVAARAAGDEQRANTLRMQNEALGQAQARVAPEVGRVEDINWDPSKALNWAGGVIGQGVASTVDSVAAATALGGAGRVAGMLPGAAGKVGRAVGTVGAPAAAFGINQRQMAGEFANTAMQDQELMARTSPQDLHQTANLYGAGAGLLDTAFPAIIGRQFAGAGLRAGMKAMGAGMGPAAKTGLGLLGEGTTEYLQGKGSQLVQGMLNPNRDTSGDASDDLNNFAGGAAGGGPLIAAGAYADAGYRRVGQAADMVGTKTGEMIDLAKEQYEGSALQGGVDKAMAAGKQKAGDLVDMARGEDGKIDLAKLAGDVRDGVEQAVERYKLSAEERSILSGDVPADIVDDPAKYTQWMVENDGKRIGFVAERLNDMLETDPRAEELFDRLTGTEDPVEQATVAEEAAQYILENNELEQLATRGQRAAAAFGELASKGATALGKGAVAAGKAAMGFGKAVFDGAAAEARKKNAQGEDYIAKGYEAWLERTGRAATERVVQGVENSPAAAQAKRRGDLFGEMLAAETQASLNARGFDAARAKNVTGLLRDAGYDIAHLAANGGPKGPAAALTLGRIANTLRTAIGPRAEQVVDELAALADPKSAKMFAQLRNEVANSRTLSGQSQARQVRATAANQMLALLPSEDAQQILQSEAAGGKLNRQWLLDTVESLANGHESPQLRKALTEKFGAEALGKMLELVGENLSAPPKLMKGTVNDGGVQGEAGVNDDGEYEAEQATDFDKRQAEKTVAKGSGPKVYGFARTQGQSLRGSTDRRDPFSPISKMSPAEARAFKDENTQRAAEGLEPLAGAPVKRPGLFKLNDTLFDGGNALEKKLADLSEATKKAGHTVAARSVYEVMRDLNFSTGKIISVYRDYLRQDADAEGVGADERKALLAAAERANRAVLDSLAAKGKDGKLVKTVFRLSAGERKEIAQAAEAYFKERYVAVAEKLSDAVPNRIELTELLNMGRAGAKVVEYARGQNDMQYQVLDEANLITFQSDLLKNKDRGLHIKADTLVGWVRTQRERTETRTEDDDKSNRTKNEAYLDDLMEGIAAVTDSGMVDEKMPARINAKGEYESFAKSIPPNLRLETMTYGQFKFAQEQRVKKRMGKELEDPTSGDYQERVAREQDRDFFAADPLEGTEREPAISRGQGQSMTAEEEAQFAALETAKERREFLKSLGLKQSGERFGDARAADAKTSGDNATPLDFFPKQKPEAVPDEFADQQFRTTKKAADTATGPEPKMSAMAKAPARAEAIVAALHKDFAAGVAMIESRLRSAARPESFADPKTRETSAVGGQHYVMPLAHALNADTISKLDLGPAEAKQLMALRAKTAQTILMADKLKENQKVALTKAMAPAVSANKVNLANYALLLQKAAQAAAPVKEAARPTPAATSMPAPGLLLKTLESRLEYLTNPPDDYSTAKAREIEAWAKRQLERISEAIKGVEEGSERYDVLDEARSTARQLVKKAASVLEGDASLAEFEGTAAPEVAAKQAPKSQQKPSGVGFKLTPRGPFTPKDQLKADRATAFIGRGSAGSSTNSYANDARAAGIPVNAGKYTAQDVVFISAEGNRAGRLDPDFKEISRAMAAGATIITDPSNSAAMKRDHNVGERAVKAHLEANGYVETAPGEWGSKAKAPGPVIHNANDMSVEELTAAEGGYYSNDFDPVISSKAELHGFVAEAIRTGDVESFSRHVEMLYDSLDIHWTEGDWGPEVNQFLKYLDSTQKHIESAIGLRDDNDQVVSRLAEAEQTLGSLLREGTLGMTDAQKIIAKAVAKVAGETPVYEGRGSPGEFNVKTGRIRIDTTKAKHIAATTLLHEGVHAATVKALDNDRELMRAAGMLMTDVLAQRPGLIHEYALTNIYEFIAEGMSNTGVQRLLMELKPSAEVAAILEGRTLWDSFMNLVRKALGIGGGNNALTQLLELGSIAMRDQGLATKESPKPQSKPSGAADWSDTGARKLSAMSTEIHNDLQRGGFAATHDSPIRHEGKFNWRAYTGMGEGNAAFGAGTYLSTGDKVHAFYKKMMSNKTEQLRDLVHAVIGSGPVTAEAKAYALEEARNKVAEYKRLLAESVYPPDAQEYRQGIEEWSQIERQISRAKIGVPFDMETESPTYHVSVGIMKAQLLNWDKPLSEQSSYVKKRLEENTLLGAPDLKGADLYQGLTDELGSQAAASDYLQSLGILGHEYAASNGRDGTTPNYVIYDDSKITTNYVHFNRQGGNSRVATQAEMDEAKAYVRKVLGPQIKVEFKDITGYSGEWLDAEQAIEISTTAAAGALSTAYHEALHGFFSKFVKSDPRVLDTLKSLAENEKILQRVAALLAGHPAALDQLKSGEERLAYIYQFWAAGKLDLPIGKPRTLLQKVRKFFRRVLGLVRDSERAVALFEAFHGGQLAEPSAAGKVIAKVLDEGTGVLKARRKLDGLTQWLAAKTMPAETVLATSESKAAQALAKEFFTNPGDEDAGGEAEGYLNARRRVAARYNNTFAQAVNGLTDRDMTDVAKYLQAEAELSDIPFGPHREAVAKIRGLLQRFYKYMSDERGLKLGHAGEKYYPRVWNTTLLHEKKDQFLTMLTTHYDAQLEQGAQGSKGKLSKEQVAERIWRALIDREGVNDKLDAQRQDGVLAPFFASKENRTLSWLEGEHVEPFLEKNLVATLSRYFHQGVRAAEYNERFGENGELLEARLREIMGELNELSVKKMQRKEFKDDAARAKWVSRQYRDISEAVGAMEGTLGKDISPAWRKANSWMTVYQNVRLLPLSLFASFVDPLGMVARGATMKEAYDSFLRGMKEVFANWGDLFREEPKERQADKWEKLAEHIGAVDAALFAHHVSDEYSSAYMERGAKKINDTLFKLNGMEAWNRGMRVAGVKNAVAFIERHAAGADKIHSARWLKELGLDPSNIPLDDDGQLITDKNVLMAVKGIGKSQAEREIDAIHYAINRWVEGAILTPNAAQRPAWGSDPHYSMFFHLKQFSYSFHQTILKRAVKEMNHGNLAPLGAFVWYIPTMIATDVVKGLVQGGGELPAYMKGYDLGDWVMHGVQRAGVLGAGQIGVDAAEDVFSLAGPGVEQVIDAMRAPLSETTIKALPAHGLYAQALK